MKSKVQNSPLRLETLEARHLFAGLFRSYDGSGNNITHDAWGSAESNFLRKTPAAYADGIATPVDDRPNARTISNRLASQGDRVLVNDRNLSAFVYAWGQFLDHDIDLTQTDPARAPFSIPVPRGDQQFDPNRTGNKTIPMVRSEFDANTGTSTRKPRQQINSVTAFIDASQVYGSDAQRAAALRTFSMGLLKTSPGNLLPWNTARLANDIEPGTDPTKYFLAGDARSNENVELTAMQTLFMREHNRVATELASKYPRWNDERLYQEARRRVAAEMQAITYNEFLPALLGPNALRPYTGYKPNINPGIANEFATAAFRFGHSMLGTDIEFLNNQGREVHPALGLRESFFSPQKIQRNGIDEVMKYLASDRAQEIDTRIVDDLRNFLFGPPGSGGMDLAALNIQRGRDHGLADYNSTRVAFGLPRIKDFAEITTNRSMQRLLASTYGSVDKIDLWVGGLAEDHMPNTSLGPLFTRIIVDQFQRLRDGDRFWYENDFRGRELNELRGTTLARVIQRNTTTQNLQSNVFFFQIEVSGRVGHDLNSNRKLDPSDKSLAGIRVQLIDISGNVLANTRTDRNGEYRFRGLDLGVYRVRLDLPANWQVSSRSLHSKLMTKGYHWENVDFVIRRS